ncbi:MAG TPA: tRNA (adenosine(37)-N6)-dimethylallyltransferase MiaA [Candidatus Acidoferrales bacterium]|nr:tRNA (adenosine(37)-N6)-dimethylallyltransferase MiaA [Candidatus Acidoferrales bacterium]
MSELPRLIVILGPTASGKSTLAIHLAERFGGEVLACDSTQVYRHFDIGTGKVPREQQRGIPHHLVDIVEPHEVFTAGEYRRRATEVLEDVTKRGKLPIMTAGTGLYLRGLLEGLAEAPERSEELRERLRQHLNRFGPEYIHRLLRKLDPEAAAKIAPRDAQKAIRAIEICVLSGERVTKLFRKGRVGLAGYAVTKIGLVPSRDALYTRIDLRVQQMLDAGWVAEVKRLMEMGIPASAKPFTFLGYSHLRGHLEGGVELKAAIHEIQQTTRRYAKRQITWFRKESEVHWLQWFGDDPASLRHASEILQKGAVA